MAVDLTQDPSTLSTKDQHRMRAQLLREGQHSLNYNKITDYKNATPTFKPVPKKRKSRAKVKPVLESFPPVEPYLPEKPQTAGHIMLRLNTRLAV